MIGVYDMPTIGNWMDMYGSPNVDIRLRAAKAILDRADEVPLDTLIDILIHLSYFGLGSKVEKGLLCRRDPDLPMKMIELLDSKDNFVREVACNVLGRFGDTMATPHLLRMIEDPIMMVRRAAGFGLAFLKDRSALEELRQLYHRHRDDDSNVRMALECALKTLSESSDDKRE